MLQLGIRPEEVRWVVQTHMHSDHMGGLGTFPKAEFVISRHGFAASRATLTCRIPEWLEPTHPVFEGGGPFGHRFTLTEAGDVHVVPTPGHTRGHQSVIFEDELTYFFAGDISFDEAQLEDGVVAGICEDVGSARGTLKRIRVFAEDRPTVYLPSHDPQSGERLARRTVTKF